MSHEIRTPLAAIMGFADLVDTTDVVQRRESAGTIRRNGEVLLSLVDDLLDVSKLQAARLRIESIPVDIWEVVQQVIELLAPRAESKGVRIRGSTDGLIPRTVCSDPTRLRQILFNLVGNAIKFTESGSVQIVLACEQAQNQLRISVRDTGIGMTSDQVAELKRFEGFFQADASTSRLFGGTGLGLQIVNELTRLLGGDLSVESEAGVGSTFTASVDAGDLSNTDWHAGTDAAQAAVPGDIGSDDQADSRGGRKAKLLDGMSILVAEDGMDNQRLIRHHLSRAGATIHLVDNGQSAVDWVDAGNKPDLVLMDIQMPIMDGYAATRRLRSTGFDTPIVALTANATTDDRKRCLAAGVDEVVTKPVDFTLLINTCRKWSDTKSRRLAS